MRLNWMLRGYSPLSMTHYATPQYNAKFIIELETKESSSRNFCGTFDIDKDKHIKDLIYSYENEPKATLRNRSPIHYGTARLSINDDNTVMKGEYWTSRQTKGEMTLKKLEK
jgi:hypothetical protein